MIDNYQRFLDKKTQPIQGNGIIVDSKKINSILFPFQRDIVIWALKLGRAAVFADCGLGKSFLQLEWAKHIIEAKAIDILIFAPLAVSEQTKREGKKLKIKVNVCGDMSDVKHGINITNYEKMHKFDLSKFGGIVIDESSILKSFSGKFKTELIDKTKNHLYKLACTATPSPNDYTELGSHSEFIGALKSKEMRAAFFVNDSANIGVWRLKKHAPEKFWNWLAQWSVTIKKPSDLGYEDGKFKLPKLSIIHKIINAEKPLDGKFFIRPAKTLNERRQARRETLSKKIEAINKLIGDSNESWMIWCDLNKESDELKSNIKNAVAIKGSDDEDEKIKALTGFIDGKIKILISKPSMFGFGLNLQMCHNIIYCGLSDSYEQFYQSLRRHWRFGQKKPVNAFIFLSDLETNVLKNIQRKERDCENMSKQIVKFTRQMSTEQIHNHKDIKSKKYKGGDRIKEEKYELINGDCVEEIKTIESNSIGLSVYSPPFSDLFCYSDSDRDMGNAKDYKEFFEHYSYLVKELYRVTQKGRLTVFHCADIPLMKERDGVIGLRDFPGDLIKAYQKEGWVYHSKHIIWKDPLIAAVRTKAIGLMHKQVVKDSAICRAGLPDYLIAMRKEGDNYNPISRDGGFKVFIGDKEDDPIAQKGIKYSHHVWRKYASPVWMDINQTNTLNVKMAKGNKDEKHVCPLQLDVIERAIELWSTENDLVLSPFMGIGSEGYIALKMKRRFVGIELKKDYYKCAKINVKAGLYGSKPTKNKRAIAKGRKISDFMRGRS